MTSHIPRAFVDITSRRDFTSHVVSESNHNKEHGISVSVCLRLMKDNTRLWSI